MYQISILYLSFIFIFYIHYTLTCTSIFELLLVDTVKKSYKENGQKNCDEVSTPSQFYIS